ncbi:hypothetical protein DV515_00013860 [Chloebia gouldiae]|uniref:Uncharacterized protein n=1 Tax=Chloebia gouldiae TaxID=44316 RepID=A0A3L8S0B0_CHLGU|nr:hypothetical protein DV515_00013860 [Chloebia gouldiae]
MRSAARRTPTAAERRAALSARRDSPRRRGWKWRWGFSLVPPNSSEGVIEVWLLSQTNQPNLQIYKILNLDMRIRLQQRWKAIRGVMNLNLDMRIGLQQRWKAIRGVMNCHVLAITLRGKTVFMKRYNKGV